MLPWRKRKAQRITVHAADQLDPGRQSAPAAAEGVVPRLFLTLFLPRPEEARSL